MRWKRILFTYIFSHLGSLVLGERGALMRGASPEGEVGRVRGFPPLSEPTVGFPAFRNWRFPTVGNPRTRRARCLSVKNCFCIMNKSPHGRSQRIHKPKPFLGSANVSLKHKVTSVLRNCKNNVTCCNVTKDCNSSRSIHNHRQMSILFKFHQIEDAHESLSRC